MSTLGSLSGQLEREEERLRELNLALIALEAQALGRTADFGLSKEDSNYTGILEPKRQDSLFVGKPGGKDSKPSCFSKLGDRIISISKKDKIWLQPIPIVSSLLVEMGQQFSKRQGDNGGISD